MPPALWSFPRIPGLEFRTSGYQDLDFLFRTLKTTLAHHVVTTFGRWDDDEQRVRLEKRIDFGATRIIRSVRDGEDCGFVALEPSSDHLFRAQLFVLPHRQRCGVGSTILADLESQAARNILPLRLTVLESNPARELYARRGFIVTRRAEGKFHMEYQPPR